MNADTNPKILALDNSLQKTSILYTSRCWTYVDALLLELTNFQSHVGYKLIQAVQKEYLSNEGDLGVFKTD